MAALDTMAALETIEGCEPDTGAPEADWEACLRRSQQPAYRAWIRAMDHLESKLCDDFPGRERARFVPLYGRILTGEVR